MKSLAPIFGLFLAAAAVIGIVAGLRGLSGFALGTAASVFNLAALWFCIKLFTSVAIPEQQRVQGAFTIVLASFVKMPVFVLAGIFTWRMGMPTPVTFLIAVGLVYSCLVWRATKGPLDFSINHGR